MSEINQVSVDSVGKTICFTVNGERFTSVEGMTVAQLVHEMKLEDKRIAVELNEEIVPRSRHETLVLREGDVVEVVTAIGGG